MILFQQLLNNTKKYLSAKDNDFIEKVYDFAKAVHGDEKRLSGHLYIDHPVATAFYLSQDRLDTQTICAALLHDVPENTNITLEEIKKQFGSEIAELVDGVTVLGKIKLKKKWFFPTGIINKITGEEKKNFEQQIDNLRKMLLAMTKDVRVILIKLADRLHNMQSLKYLSKDKQVRIARETLEIFAPIAYRLGIGQLQGELEDLAFPYVFPNEYQKIKKVVGKKYEQKEIYIDKFKKTLVELLNKNNIKYEEIHGRRKHLYSLWRKLQRYNFQINEIYDLVAVRIIVQSVETCYKVLGLIHNKYKPLIGRIKDYIAVVKPNGYQSLHTTVFGPQGEIIEIQIRTLKMHEQAEFGIAAHWHYSDYKKNSQDTIKNKAVRISSKLQIDWIEELARWQEKISNPEEWNEGLKMDFFRDQIFIFTPEGDVYNLPIGATPIDFAFAIHSDVGNSCRGAKVNGRIVRLSYPLNNGQIVEIIKDKKSSSPKKDWLRFVKTHKARERIKSYFSKN